jgi:8-oxo-dGTP diphosphatase
MLTSNPGLYALPGGYLDRDETIAAGALRELQEETGYIGSILSLFSICDNPNRPKEDRQNIAFTYLIEVSEQTDQPDEEVAEVIWLDLQKLPNQNMFAFDHFNHIQWYLDYQRNSKEMSLPLLKSK